MDSSNRKQVGSFVAKNLILVPDATPRIGVRNRKIKTPGFLKDYVM